MLILCVLVGCHVNFLFLSFCLYVCVCVCDLFENSYFSLDGCWLSVLPFNKYVLSLWVQKVAYPLKEE